MLFRRKEDTFLLEPRLTEAERRHLEEHRAELDEILKGLAEAYRQRVRQRRQRLLPIATKHEVRNERIRNYCKWILLFCFLYAIIAGLAGYAVEEPLQYYIFIPGAGVGAIALWVFLSHIRNPVMQLEKVGGRYESKHWKP